MQRFLRYALAGFALVAPLVATASLGAQANASGSVTQQFNCKASFDAYAVSDAVRHACGISKHSLERVIALQGGGQGYEYSVDGAPATILVPPKGFNPLTATAAQLDEYGLPSRPTDQSALGPWLKMMSNYHPVTPPNFMVSIPDQRHPRVSATYLANNWSGWVATGNNGNYTIAEGYWNEVSLGSSCTGSNELTWAGLGGWTSSVLAQDGTAMNVSGLSQHQAWWEIVTPSGSNINPIAGIVGAAGYGFVALTKWIGGGYDFYVYSYSSGLGTTVQVGNSNYTGDTADFIIERGLHNNTLSPLSNFYYLNYLDAWVNGNGSGNGVGHYSNQNINMYNFSKGYLLANTSGLSNNTTFTIYYDNCQ
ncbi:MAG: hypothetical protein E6H93_12220 [Chloroflexi bacterium]|nr:MAG: hypothetical protein E6H93_12220 [Chloroflexota bacterium]